ncbi:hypothetical protein TNCV_759761 [Trichonephila clavipes]|nr:hypothetical protein TNCV_759761 [Trichonephila clavipes]
MDAETATVLRGREKAALTRTINFIDKNDQIFDKNDIRNKLKKLELTYTEFDKADAALPIESSEMEEFETKYYETIHAIMSVICLTWRMQSLLLNDKNLCMDNTLLDPIHGANTKKCQARMKKLHKCKTPSLPTAVHFTLQNHLHGFMRPITPEKCLYGKILNAIMKALMAFCEHNPKRNFVELDITLDTILAVNLQFTDGSQRFLPFSNTRNNPRVVYL